MSDFGESLAKLAEMAAAPQEAERIRAMDAVSHYVKDGSPICGAGPRDWVRGSGDWAQVSCSECMKANARLESEF